jgi:NTP pyrophosphatase (non-canonical NTP hydrolase)
MNPNEYQDLTIETEIYSKAAQEFVHGIFTASDIGSTTVKDAIKFTSIMYCAGKLNGEAGEIAEEVFKAFRDNGKIDDERAERLFKELGDTLWYIARLLDLLGYDLEDCMEANVEKLISRKERGVLHGSGSNR